MLHFFCRYVRRLLQSAMNHLNWRLMMCLGCNYYSLLYVNLLGFCLLDLFCRDVLWNMVCNFLDLYNAIGHPYFSIKIMIVWSLILILIHASSCKRTRLSATGQFWPTFDSFSSSADLTLGSGITVPAGAILVVPLHLVHMDASVWGNDAGQFNPHRFLEKDVDLGGLSLFSYFSALNLLFLVCICNLY
jgi:hypothetical protein